MASNKAFGSLLVEIAGSAVGLQKTMTEANGMLKDFVGQVNNMNRILTASFEFEIGAKAIEGIKALTSSVIDLAREGEKAQNLEKAFVAIGGSVSQLDKAKEATLGAVSAVDLMTAANRGLVAGIPGFSENFGKIAELGAKVGQALGISTTEGIDKVTTALIKGRPAMLQQVGLFIDTAAAAKAFALEHGIAATTSGSFEKALNKQEKQLANTEQAMRQLNDASSRFPALIDTATKAQQAANNEWNLLIENIGKQMNQNPELIGAWRELQKTIHDIDFGEIGKNIASLTAVFVNWANLGIKVANAAINQLFDDLKRLQLVNTEYVNYTAAHPISSAIPIIGQGAALSHAIDAADADFAELKQVDRIKAATTAANDFASSVNSAYQKFQGGIKPTFAELDKLSQDAASVGGVIKKAGGVDVIQLREGLQLTADQYKILQKNGVAVKTMSDTLNNGLQSANDKAAKLHEELVKAVDAQETQKLKENFTEALKLGNFDAAQDYLAQYKDAVSKLADEEVKKFGDKDPELAAKFKQNMIDNAINPMANEVNDKLSHAFDDAVKHLVSGFTEATSAFSEITSGIEQTFGIKLPQGMQKVLDTAKGVYSIFEGTVKLFEAMEAISKAIAAIDAADSANRQASAASSAIGGGGGGGGGGLLSNITNLFGGGGDQGGYGQIGSNADGSAIMGPTSSGAGGGALSGYSGAWTGTSAYLGYAGAAYGLYNNTANSSSWEQTGGSVVGTAVGAYFGGPWGAAAGSFLGGTIGGAIGDMTAGTNADMNARRQVQSYLNAQTGGDYQIGNSSAFDAGGSGFANFDKIPKQSQAAFSAVGDQIKQMLGITQDIGPQIGAILVNNIGSGGNELKALMDKLGISVTQLTDNLLKAGKSGAKSWLEVESAIEGVERVANAAKKSESAAIEELVTSAGRGQQALDGIRDIAIAASKEGAKTLDDLKKKLIAGGLGADQVDEIMKALKQRGIDSLTALISSSDRTAGAVVADITAMGFKFKELADNINNATAAVQNLATASSGIDTSSSSDTGSAPVTAHAFGGIITKPTFFKYNGGLHLMGENGPEAIVPLNSIGGISGMRSVRGGNNGGAIHFHIDARNAEAGVEYKIQQAIMDAREELIGDAVAAVGKERFLMDR